MVEWVSEQDAEGLNLRGPVSGSEERCPFCSKEFPTHNAYTAHLRWHGDAIENLVFGVIRSADKPLRLATIQNLTGANFSVKNAVQRLAQSGKIHRTGQGYSTRRIVPARKKAAPQKVRTEEQPITVNISSQTATAAIPDTLIVATLKRLQPEVYNDIVNEIVEGMFRYAAGMAELNE